MKMFASQFLFYELFPLLSIIIIIIFPHLVLPLRNSLRWGRQLRQVRFPLSSFFNSHFSAEFETMLCANTE